MAPFAGAGADVTAGRRPNGGQPPLDPVSDDAGRSDRLTRRRQDPRPSRCLPVPRYSPASATDYDAVFFPVAMVRCGTWREDPHSIALIEAFYNAGKPVAAVWQHLASWHRVTFQGQPIVKDNA